MTASANAANASCSLRARELFEQRLRALNCKTDRMFVGLLLVQFVGGLAAALLLTPRTWSGSFSSLHPHVPLTLWLGGAITALPVYLGLKHPGETSTRHVIAVCQTLWSALLIHISGGRIETHFHIFGSLAFLAVYRDIGVLATATVVVAADHMLRGIYLPQSVFGVLTASNWRWVEHAAWVVFEDVVLVLSCVRGRRELNEMVTKQAEVEGVAETVERQVVERTRELALANQAIETARRYMTAVYQAVPGALFVFDRRNSIREMNMGVSDLLEYDASELSGQSVATLFKPEDVPNFADIEAAAGNGAVLRCEKTCRTKAGLDVPVLFSARLLPSASGTGHDIVCVALDLREQKRLEVQARQSQKLESLGQLAAGIAHEINTPTQFLGDNTRFVQSSLASVLPLLQACAALRADAPEGEAFRAQTAELARAASELDLPFLLEELPRALEDSLGGVERIGGIVRAMKEFSHPGGQNKQAADVNRCIESTIIVARNEWKYVATLELELDPHLPPVPCYPQDVNQVILNMVVNAAHAIQDARAKKNDEALGKITIATCIEGDEFVLRISDTGCGIPAAIRERVFDPFFTTKEVGKGTGQGLAIAHHVVVEKHGGRILIESVMGVGTTFIVRLPLREAQLASAA